MQLQQGWYINEKGLCTHNHLGEIPPTPFTAPELGDLYVSACPHSRVFPSKSSYRLMVQPDSKPTPLPLAHRNTTVITGSHVHQDLRTSQMIVGRRLFPIYIFSIKGCIYIRASNGGKSHVLKLINFFIATLRVEPTNIFVFRLRTNCTSLHAEEAKHRLPLPH